MTCQSAADHQGPGEMLRVENHSDIGIAAVPETPFSGNKTIARKKGTNMKHMIAVGGITAVLFLLLGTTSRVYGQEEHGKEQEKQQAGPPTPTAHTPQQASSPW